MSLAALQCFAAGTATEVLPTPVRSAAEDVEAEPDFSLVRQKIVQEQRNDPMLRIIIAKLEASAQVLLHLEDENNQPDPMDTEDEGTQPDLIDVIAGT